MKKIIYIISLVVSSVLYTSCDALDLAPEDYFGSGNYWSNEAQVSGYMTGMHSQLRSNYSMFYILGELRGGTQRVGTSSENTSLDYANLRSNVIDQDRPGVDNWNGLYSPIMQVNHFIEKVENECVFLDDTSRKHYLAQAYGLRALYYFMLYKTYGGVPIVTEVELLNGEVTADKFYVERSTPEATLEFIKGDIGKSETNYSDVTVANDYNKTLWSKAATLMLKAEIYMWSAKVTISGHTATGTEDLKVAEAALNQIIGKFELLPEFDKVFSTSNRNNKEVIFTLHFADGEATNWGGAFLYQDAVFIGQVYGRDGKRIETDTLNLKGTGGVFRHEYTYDFWSTYDSKDTRRDATFLEYYTKDDMSPESFGCVLKKCIGSINSNNSRIYDTDVIVYRYADALLMMAEVANGLGKSCSSYINDVRKRAYGDDYAGHEYTDGSFETNELAILHERDKEFVWEGKRWFDVVRMQDASHKSLAFSASASYPATKALISTNEEHKLLWPLDINTMNINPLLEQTPGYEQD
ncbi:MAG: RagB/SusD family nutrient uptake outer membrane protein [Bacteroides sp.]|nr:RagB/SusD family nutrient uptake outer membrane protein [Bacteroides sp.]